MLRECQWSGRTTVSELEVRLPWPVAVWGLGLHLVKGSLPLTYVQFWEPVQMTGRALNIHVFRGGPHFALKAEHTEFSQQEGPIFLSTRAVPRTACPGVASAKRSCLILIYQPRVTGVFCFLGFFW